MTNKPVNSKDLAIAGFVVGFVGDLTLNVLTQRLKVLNAGLVDYFPLHGTVEAAFIAGGLVGFTAYIAGLGWEYLGKSFETEKGDFSWGVALYLFIFGAVLDNAFRFGNLMPSLCGMYHALHPAVSMSFAGGPLVAAYGLAYIYRLFLH